MVMDGGKERRLLVNGFEGWILASGEEEETACFFFLFLRGRLILLTAIEIFIITFTYSLKDMAIEHYHYKNIIILYTETTRKVTLG